MNVSRATLLVVWIAATALGVASCGDDEPPTTPSPTPTAAIAELFSGTLRLTGSSFYSFSVDTTSNVGLTLLSLATSINSPPISTPLVLGLGIPSGTGCALMASTTTGPGLAPHISRPVESGIYCVSIANNGALSQPADFLIRIIIVPSGVAFPTREERTETFATNLPIQGLVTRTLTATQPGTVRITLQSVGPPSNVAVGLGLGFWRPDGSGCSLSQSLVTPAGSAPQITATVDPGVYCIKVFDTGTLADTVAFSIQVVYP